MLWNPLDSVSYISGLIDGLKIDESTNEGKIFENFGCA